MPKKSKLLAALDAHKGRDFGAEKDKKQRKEAGKKKRLKNEKADEEKENNAVITESVAPELDVESEGWESDESEAAGPTTVINSIDAPSNPNINLCTA